MEIDSKLKMLYAAQSQREIGEKEQVEWVSLRQIDLSDWYPVDMAKVFKYYGEFFYKTSKPGVPMGIGTPLRVFQINGGRDNGYKIADGYHRAATQLAVAAVALGSVSEEQLPKMVFEEKFTPVFIRTLFTDIENLGSEAESLLKVPVIIKKDQTSEDLWNARTSALIGAHEKVMFVRILKMFKDTWPVDRYGDLRQAINQAITAAKNRWHIDAEMNIEGVQAIQKICDDWNREPSTIKDYLDISEKLHPDLINRVRVSANRDEDQFGINQARALANNFPETRYLEWQLVFYEMLEKKRIQREARLLDAACVLTKKLIPFYLSVPMSEPAKLAELAAEIVLDRQGPDVRVDTILRIIGDLQKAPWWNTEGKVRYLVISLVRKAHEAGLNNQDVFKLTGQVTALFRKEETYIVVNRLETTLVKAERKIAGYKSEDRATSRRIEVGTRRVKRNQVVFSYAKSRASSEVGQLPDELIRVIEKQDSMILDILIEVLANKVLDDDILEALEDEDYDEWVELMDWLVEIVGSKFTEASSRQIIERQENLDRIKALYQKYLQMKNTGRS